MIAKAPRALPAIRSDRGDCHSWRMNPLAPTLASPGVRCTAIMGGYAQANSIKSPADHAGSNPQRGFPSAAGLTTRAAADRLGIDEASLLGVLAGGRLHDDLANRLARVFNTSREYWLNAQAVIDQYDRRDEGCDA